jgi:thiamine-phosphate pyrophosphorylase
VLEPALRGGVDIFQLRMKDASDAEILAAAVVARQLCDEAGALFIINDRPDLAADARADGVHVGQDDMTLAYARAAAGHDLIVGRSTHAESEIAEAAEADYFAVGPIHRTPTKPGRPPVGLELITHAAEHASDLTPWFAIGGIDDANVGEVVAAGATRVVVVRAIAEATDPERAARTLRAAL